MTERWNIERWYDDMIKRRRKVVGWGTGSIFEYYYKKLPVEPDYIIDNNSDKWGQCINGVEVKSPEALRGEDPDGVIVIIYSSFIDQISEQIRTIGDDYVCMPAGVACGHDEVEVYLRRMNGIMGRGCCDVVKASGNAVVIQGPVTTKLNVDMIRFYRYTCPNDYIIVSTWEASSPALIREVRELVDECILSTPPKYNGYQNRNYQIASTLAGVKRAKELGMDRVLKTRTDVSFLTHDVMRSCEDLRSLYDNSVARSYGLENRLVVPETYTRKYMLYHPGDLVMYGNVEDMLKYWDIEGDSRQFTLMDDSWKAKTLKSISMDMGPAESYLGRTFCETIGWEARNTVEDSWSFYRDLFIVVDNGWWDLFWFKYPKISSKQITKEVHECVSHYFWQQLYHGAVAYDGAVDIDNILWDSFYKEGQQIA